MCRDKGKGTRKFFCRNAQRPTRHYARSTVHRKALRGRHFERKVSPAAFVISRNDGIQRTDSMLFTEEYLKRKIKFTMSRTGFIAPAGVTSIIPTLFIPKLTTCPSTSPACCVNHILKKSSRHCSTRCCFWTSFARMKQGRGVTEQLKADDRWRRVQKMGYIHNAAEAFVLREVVNH